MRPAKAAYALPGGSDLPPGVWQMVEVAFGSFGAALIAFLLTAMPEWTDTPRQQGRPLWLLCQVAPDLQIGYSHRRLLYRNLRLPLFRQDGGGFRERTSSCL